MFGGPWEIILILAVVLLVFGASRLRNIGSDLGSAIKGFRSAIKDDADNDEEAGESPTKSTDRKKQKPSSK